MDAPPWQFLGNVDLALSEIRSLKNEEDRAEALIRRKVIFGVLFSASPRVRAYATKNHLVEAFFVTNVLETVNNSDTTLRFRNITFLLPVVGGQVHRAEDAFGHGRLLFY